MKDGSSGTCTSETASGGFPRVGALCYVSGQCARKLHSPRCMNGCTTTTWQTPRFHELVRDPETGDYHYLGTYPERAEERRFRPISSEPRAAVPQYRRA